MGISWRWWKAELLHTACASTCIAFGATIARLVVAPKAVGRIADAISPDGLIDLPRTL